MKLFFDKYNAVSILYGNFKIIHASFLSISVILDISNVTHKYKHLLRQSYSIYLIILYFENVTKESLINVLQENIKCINLNFVILFKEKAFNSFNTF